MKQQHGMESRPHCSQLRRCISGIAQFGLTGGVICTSFGFLGSLGWFFAAFSHFKWHLGIGFVALCAIFLALNDRRQAAFSAFLAAVNLLFVLAAWQQYLPLENGSDRKERLRVATINILGNNADPDKLLAFLQEQQPDLVALQELRGRVSQALESLKTLYPYQLKYPKEDNFGIGILSKYPFSKAEIVYFDDETAARMGTIRGSPATPEGGRFPLALADLTIKGKWLTFIAAHPPPPLGANYQYNASILKNLAWYAKNRPGPLLIAGDFNATPWSDILRPLTDAGLFYAKRGPNLYTSWPARLPPWLRLPIDHILATHHFFLDSSWLGPDIGSDHLPLMSDLSWPALPGP